MQKLSKNDTIGLYIFLKERTKTIFRRCYMSTKSAELQMKLNELEELLKGNAPDVQKTIWENDKRVLTDQLQAALLEESQQFLQERVEQAKETGYILDTIEIDGLPSIAFSHTPENHELLAIAVQKLFLSQEDAFNSKVSELEDEIRGLNDEINTVRDDSLKDLKTIHQHELDIADLGKKLKNAADQLLEKDEEIKKIKEQQVNVQAVPIAPLSEEEKEKNLMIEVMGKQIKVVNVVAINPDSFTNKMFQGTNAVTGAVVEDYYIYLSLLNENKPKRYEEISLEAAQQLREEYNSKKAEIELSIPTISTPDIPPVNEDTRQDEAATDKLPIEEEIRTAAFGLAQESSNSDREVVEESEVVTRAEFNKRVGQLEIYVQQLNQRAGLLPDEQAVA